MSVYGEFLTGTIAIDGTSTGAIDLGRDYDFIEVVIPTLVSGTLKVQTSSTLGGTYTDLGNGVVIPATTGAFNDVWQIGGWRYIKIVSSATQTVTARNFVIRGMRY